MCLLALTIHMVPLCGKCESIFTISVPLLFQYSVEDASSDKQRF